MRRSTRRARRVQLRLEAGDADIVLTVEDDGEASGASLRRKPAWDCSACRSGWFRSAERLQFERREAGGARLVARIPTMRAEP